MEDEVKVGRESVEALKESVKAIFLSAVDPEKWARTDNSRFEVFADMFTTAMDFLRGQPVNVAVRDLCKIAWDVHHHRYAVLACNAPVESMSLSLLNKPRKVIAVLMPPAWMDMIEADPLMQMGAMIFCASEAVDLHELKIEGLRQRAEAYEAEWLKTLVEQQPTLEAGFNPYQQALRQNYPQGIATPGMEAHRREYATVEPR